MFVLKKRVKDFLIFSKINDSLVKNFALVRVCNILKSKESPRVTFERTKRVSQPEFTDQDL